MSNPSLSEIGDVYFDGVLNTDWNTNSGTYGLDDLTNRAYITASIVPSFLGASGYDVAFSSFSAQIEVAPGDISQTALVIQKDSSNYVEMHVGPYGKFQAYSTNNTEVTQADDFPDYDPVAHAYWRISEDGGYNFIFDASPDGSNWTNLGSVPYFWDGTNTTVIFLAGFNEPSEGQLRAYISNVNLISSQFVLSATISASSNIDGTLEEIAIHELFGRGGALSGPGSSFNAILGISPGGLTDFGIWDSTQPDAALSRVFGSNSPTIDNSITGRPWVSATAPTQYRDGSFWKPALYAGVGTQWAAIPDQNYQTMTNVQMEQNSNTGNRLSLDASSYQERCLYAPQSPVSSAGSTKVERSADRAYSGLYSGHMHYGGTPITLTSGLHVYYPYTTSESQATVVAGETIKGSVYVSLNRPGAQWFADIQQFDVNHNLIGATHNGATITNVVTHPGSWAWQQGSVTASLLANTKYVAVVPVIVASGLSQPEDIYMDNHFITGISPNVSNVPSTYQAPRQLNISVRADEINYALNGGFNADISGWGIFQSGVTNASNVLSVQWDNTVGLSGLGSLKATYVNPTTATGGSSSYLGPGSVRVSSGSGVPQIQGLKIGHTYNVSAWVKKGPNCPDIILSTYDANGTVIITTNTVTASTNPDNLNNGWIRLSVTVTVPPNGLSDYSAWLTIAWPDILAAVVVAPFNFWIDCVQVTEGTNPQPYFDGSFSSADYQWEGIANKSRSHYYKDLTNKMSRVNQIVKAYSPVGSNYQILYAQPPN